MRKRSRRRRKARSWETATTVPSKPSSARSSASRGVDVEVVGRLVEQQQVVALELEAEDLQPRLLAAAERVVGAPRRLGEAVARERAHRALEAPTRSSTTSSTPRRSKSARRVELGEKPGRDAGADEDLAVVGAARRRRAARMSCVLPPPLGPTRPTRSPKWTSSANGATRSSSPRRAARRRAAPSRRRAGAP